MDLRQTARWLAVLPLLALIVTVGAAVGAPGQVLPVLQGLWPRTTPPDNAFVAGQVTKDGQPVVNATVEFRGAGGRTIAATTDAEGRYSARLPEGGVSVVVLPFAERGPALVESAPALAVNEPSLGPVSAAMEDGPKVPRPPGRRYALDAGEQTLNLVVDE